MKTLFTLLLLSVVVIGRAQMPFPNGDMENWYTTTTGHDLPSDANWFNVDSFATCFGYHAKTIFRSEDAYSGSSALMMRSFDTADLRYAADIYTGICCNSTGGVIVTYPYNDRLLFLGFYYKYIVDNNDTALVELRFTDTIDGSIKGGVDGILTPAPSYTKAIFPIYHASLDIPGYMRLRITGTKFYNRTDSMGSSTLLIDSIFFTNDTSSVTSLEEIAFEHSLKLYPNPAADYIEIPEPLQQSAVNSIIIMNTAGQRFAADNNRNRISIAHLPSGLYILCVTDKDGRRYRGKFAKQ